MDLSVVPYQQQQQDNDTFKPTPKTTTTIKYKECMRNHAASIGGHANDGCGEFMPLTSNAVVDDNKTKHNNNYNNNSLDSLTCAACGCHRNFHRREDDGGRIMQPVLLPPPPPQQPMLLYKNGAVVKHKVDTSCYDYDRRSETPEREEVVMNLNAAGVGSGRSTTVMKNKRCRTKFTQEQKDKMLEFAERIGWRINRNDDMALNQFCNEVGVKRNVLKVWMHNNKNALRRRESASSPSPSPINVAAAPPPQAAGV